MHRRKYIPDEVGGGRRAILRAELLVAQLQLRAHARVRAGAVAAWQHLALCHVLQDRGRKVSGIDMMALQLIDA